MKWLVLALLALNGFVWFAGDFWVPDPVKPVLANGTLPRVSTLKVDAGATEALSEPEPEPDPEPAPEPVLRTCVQLGWFETADNAHEAYLALGSPGDLVSVTEQERMREPLHWVIVPPQPEDQALRLFNDLQRRGMDSYLVTQGENKNAISLGLFESKNAALRMLEAKKRQNLNAVLATFPRNQISYALVFEVTQTVSADAGDERFSDYRDDFELVEISRCEGIATTPENP